MARVRGVISGTAARWGPGTGLVGWIVKFENPCRVYFTDRVSNCVTPRARQRCGVTTHWFIGTGQVVLVTTGRHPASRAGHPRRRRPAESSRQAAETHP